MPNQWVAVRGLRFGGIEVQPGDPVIVDPRARPRRWEYPIGGVGTNADIKTLDRAIQAIRSVLPEGEYQFVAPDRNRVVGDIEVAHVQPFESGLAGWTSMMPEWPFQYRRITDVPWGGYPGPVLYVR